MIVPSIDLMDGRAVQLRHGRDFVLDGGDPLERLEQFGVAGEVAVVDLDAALGRGSNTALVRALVRRAPCRVGGGIRDLDAARAWLDAGAERVVIGTAATPEFCGALPRERVIAAVDSVRGEVVVEGWRTATGRPVLDTIQRLAPYVGGFLFTQVEREGAMRGFDLELVRAAVAAAGGARVTAAGGITTADEIAELDRLGADAQVGMALYTERLTLGDAVAAPLTGEPDALWPTVVCDDGGRTLGLAWSSRASLRRAVAERRGIYWSRSRGAIWVKGESSGNVQRLLAVEPDCDRDTLRFVVRQEGTGFCHRGTRTCFRERFDLGDLERVIAARRAGADPASGTGRLLTEPGLLEAKLAEEAAELARAATRDDVVHESADLLYFVLVALARAGGSLADVEAELGRRRRAVSRRPMEAKR
jgi:phosphoribosyl-ATP pyrophosphohydrolase